MFSPQTGEAPVDAKNHGLLNEDKNCTGTYFKVLLKAQCRQAWELRFQGKQSKGSSNTLSEFLQ